MRFTLAIAVIALTGCATYDTSKAIDPNFVSRAYLSRQEVIAATKECETAGMRAKVVYVDATLQGKRIQVPHDVFCEPSTVIRRSPYAPDQSPYIKP